jgi:hypothetical protein
MKLVAMEEIGGIEPNRSSKVIDRWNDRYRGGRSDSFSELLCSSFEESLGLLMGRGLLEDGLGYFDHFAHLLNFHLGENGFVDVGVGSVRGTVGSLLDGLEVAFHGLDRLVLLVEDTPLGDVGIAVVGVELDSSV